jgi:ABC-2 type transport system ATP-binding protein
MRERSLRHVTVTFGDRFDPGSIEAIEGVRILDTEGSAVRLSAPETAMDALVKALSASTVVDLVSEPADLEEIFLELYRDGGDGG